MAISVTATGEGFSTGIIKLGELELSQVSSFTKVWATHEGGPDNLGATFFQPSMPAGFSVLGCYCQPNNKPLFGWVLAGKDAGNALAKPVDYKLVWSSKSAKMKQDGYGYIWLPMPPQGYAPVGYMVTSSSSKPSLDQIRCVRSDLTDACEDDRLVWSTSGGVNVYGSRPSTRGTQAPGVAVGTFMVHVDGDTSTPSISCLKNKDFILSHMPNLPQIDSLLQAYSPWVYFHPDEVYLPCSLTWLFNNGALLYKQGDPAPAPAAIDPNGSNLPQGGSNDGAYWVDLPVDEGARDRAKRGDIESAESYIHVKPMLGGTFTDIQIWVFFPFNGPSRAKVQLVNIPLGKTGEHVGDWEHLTLRVSNFNGELWRVYFSQHSGGKWVDASELEFEGGNKAVGYASLHGHAFYPKAGLVLQGNESLGIGIRNDTAKGKVRCDTGERSVLVAVEHLSDSVVGPAWLGYTRKWGPKISYDLADEMQKIAEVLPGNLKDAFEKVIDGIPREVFGEEGPTGPNMKRSWNGDEI
ncbi:hypothetical protein ACLOJK_028686 [Asimina triloba]